MKIKVVIAVLAVACIGLGIALIVAKKQADNQHEADVSSIVDFSNQLAGANEHLKDSSQVNLTLSNDLASSQQQLATAAEQMTQLSNSLTASLTAANAALADTKTSLASAQEMVTNLNSRISDLEAQNHVLDDQAQSLSNQLAQLTAQIEDTKTQLAVSRTNAAFLQHELQKQLAQRAELEHKFNDLAELRAQVKKLKNEMFIARRMQLDRSGTGVKKGGELLMTHNDNTATVSRTPTGGNYDLNVEVGSDGSVKVIPPMGGSNGPAH